MTGASLQEEKCMEKKSLFKPKTIASIKDFACVLPALIFLAVFTYYPIGKLVQISFTDWNLLNPTWQYVGLENWKWLFCGSGTRQSAQFPAGHGALLYRRAGDYSGGGADFRPDF